MEAPGTCSRSLLRVYGRKHSRLAHGQCSGTTLKSDKRTPTDIKSDWVDFSGAFNLQTLV